MSIDSLGMVPATFALADQIEAARVLASQAQRLPSADGITNVLVLGMGGSGIAGDVLRAVAGLQLRLPLVVSKGYLPPASVDEHTLCFALSFSGNTEETVAAAAQAAAAGARLVIIASGGELAAMAELWGAPVVALPEGIPMPRAGIGAVAIPPLVVLARMGLLDGIEVEIDAAVAQLRLRAKQLEAEGNDAIAMARRIGRTMPILYGAGDLGAVAALRWKNQVNENAKAPAFTGVVPELLHNEICGWGQHGDVTRQVFTLVLLRHGFEHAQEVRRFDLVREIVDEVVAGIEEVTAEGEGRLAQLFDLMFFGDVVSLQMAGLEGIDPGPIPILDDIKARLRE